MYGTKIRILRQCRGLNQEDVAQQLGINQTAYSKIENNHSKVSEQQLETLAALFGVSIADIKSQEPIVINFHNSPQSSNNNVGEINYHLPEKKLEEMKRQLMEKDKQIEKLLTILDKK
jgi:transcriptional regulator with XRE-family HTH domain